MESSAQVESKKSRGPLYVAAFATLSLLALVGLGLWRLTVWLEPPPLELPPAELRSTPGLQRFVPTTDRRLLARVEPTSDEDEAPVVPADHPFAKTKVTGRVYDLTTQEGISGAEVRVKASFGKPKLGTDPSGEVSVRTRSDGSFAIKGLPPGIFTLQVSAAGYVPVETGIEKYSAIEDDDGFDVGLLSGRAIEGRVVTQAGAPVPRAEVFQMYGVESNRTAGPPTVADDNGRFVIDPVGTAPLELLATHPEHGSGLQRVEAGDQPTEVEIRLPELPTCEGVVSSGGVPIAGAKVVPEVLGVAEGPSWVIARADLKRRGLTTGPDGRFRLVLGPQGGGIRVSASGYVAKSFFRGGPQGCRLDAELEAAISFTGTVLAADGTPVEHAEVGVAGATQDGRDAFISGETDESGRFQVEGAPADGPYQIRIFHPEHPPLYTGEASLAGDHTYRLEAPVRLLGKLVDAKNGGPITRYQYGLRGPMSRRGDAFSVSGALEIPALIPGHYQVQVSAEGYEPTRTEVELGAGDPGDLVIRLAPAGTIVGRVKAPGPNASLVVQAWIDEDELGAEAMVGADGAFSLTNLRRGNYQVTVFGHEGGEVLRGARDGVVVESGEVTQGIEIPLSREPAPDGARGGG